MTSSLTELEREAVAVLASNDRATHIAPAPSHYSQQWLWDSAYCAIGLAHVNPPRAAKEIVSLLTGQWSNGMVPHMVEHGRPGAKGLDLGRWLWKADRSASAPRGVRTSGITQPPVLAEAVDRVSAALAAHEAHEFLRHCVPRLCRYHEWFYRERDPHYEGLVCTVHPWETGMDNAPPWMAILAERTQSLLAHIAASRPLRAAIGGLRPDTKTIDPGERTDLIDGLRSIDLLLELRRRRYTYGDLIHTDLPCVQDVAVNAILIRNNAILRRLAASIEHPLPTWLIERMATASHSLGVLWDATASMFLSRDARSGRLLGPPTVAGLLALYAGNLTPSHRDALLNQLDDGRAFRAPYPAPSVPLDSSDFHELRYWSGPTWMNINWHLIDGLERFGQPTRAEALKHRTLDMVARSGMHEYFSALDGRGLGFDSYSWTAALTLDLVCRS